MSRKPLPHFRFIAVDLPTEWQEAINEAYKQFALEQIAKGGKTKSYKTDFVRFVFEFYLAQNNYSVKQ